MLPWFCTSKSGCLSTVFSWLTAITRAPGRECAPARRGVGTTEAARWASASRPSPSPARSDARRRWSRRLLPVYARHAHESAPVRCLASCSCLLLGHRFIEVACGLRDARVMVDRVAQPVVGLMHLRDQKLEVHRRLAVAHLLGQLLAQPRPGLRHHVVAVAHDASFSWRTLRALQTTRPLPRIAR